MTVLLGAAPGFSQTGSGTSSGSTSGSRGSYGTGSTGSSSSTDADTRRDTQSQSSSSADRSSTGTYGTGTTDATRSTDTTRSTGTYGSGTTTTMTGRETASGKLGWMDRRFVTKAADSGATEINLAKLAAERASNPEVKSFAQKLIEDHQQVSSELKSLATQKNVTLDDEDLGSDRAYKRLSKKSGMEFDQEFVEHMIDDHEDSVKRFEKASTDAKDPELRAFAAKHVDHLREHLQKAQSLRSTIMPTGRTDSSATPGSSSLDSTSSPSSTDATGTTSPSSSTRGTGTTDSDPNARGGAR